MLNIEEKLRLQAALEALPRTVEFRLCDTEGSEFGKRLRDFVETACGRPLGKAAMAVADLAGQSPASPCFSVVCGERANVVYAAVPEGHQFPVFLRILQMIAREAVPPAGAGPKLRLPLIPAEVWVFVSPECPLCPSAVEAAAALSSRNPAISSFVIDAQQFSGLAESYGVRAVPATVIDRRLVLAGALSAARLAESIGMRGTPEFDRSLMRSFIETRHMRAAAESLRHANARHAVLSLLQEPELSTRMGALVVLHEALGSETEAMRAMVPALVALLFHQDPRLRGDIADLLGSIGDARAMPALKQLTADPDPDVAEAAAEALESIRGREAG